MACSYNCYLPCLTESFNVGSICGSLHLREYWVGLFLLDENQWSRVSLIQPRGGGLLVGLFS